VKNKFIHFFTANWPLFAAIAVVSLVFWDKINPPPGQYLFGWDTVDYQYHALNYFHDEINRGVFPWWNPFVASGYPFSASPGAPVFYPPIYIFAALPLGQAMSWYSAFHFLLSLIGMYYLCRLWCSKSASFIAGIVFALSGFFAPRVLTGEINHIVAGAYAPFILRFVWQGINSKSPRIFKVNLAKSALLFGLSLISGDPRVPMMTMMVAGLVTLIQVIYYRTLKPILFIGIQIFLGILITSIWTIPLVEFTDIAHRSIAGLYSLAANGSLSLSQFQQFIYPIGSLYRPNVSAYPPFPEGLFYSGIVSLVIFFTAIINLFVKRRYFVNTKKPVLVTIATFALITFLGLWLAMGPNAPVDLFYLLWTYVPGFHFMRVPLRFFFIFIIGFAPLLAFSIDSIRNKIMTIIFTFLILIELICFSRSFLILSADFKSTNDPEIIRLFENQGLTRMLPNYFYYQRLGNSFDMDSPMSQRFFAANGYIPFIPENYYRFYIDAFIDYDSITAAGTDQLPIISNIDNQILSFLNVKYVYGAGDMGPGANSSYLKFILENPYRWYRLYENPDILPRFYLTPKAVFLKNLDEVEKSIINKSYSLKNYLLLVATKPEEVGTTYTSTCLKGNFGEVKIVAYGTNSVKLKSNTACDAYMSTSEIIYPGWEVRIDGRKAPLLTGNYAFRAVFIPAGNHQITFEYVPRIFLFGAAITFLSLTVIFVMLYQTRKKI
jgi:hypothetical protein